MEKPEIPVFNLQHFLKESTSNLASGAAGGVSCKLIEYPFDTVKTIQQSDAKNSKSVRATILELYREGGVKNLYRGLPGPLVGSMFENAILFTGCQIGKVLSDKIAPQWHNTKIQGLFAGGFSGFCVAHLLTPLELVKCRMQVDGLRPRGERLYKSDLDCFKKAVSSDGYIRGLFRGHSATLVREIPGNMAWFGVYEGLCQTWTPEGATRQDLPKYLIVLAGGFAGMSYWSAAFPADVAKSRMQTEPDYKGLSLKQAISRIYTREGFKALYKGWPVTVARAMPSNGALFLTAELVQDFLRTDD